MVQFRPLQVQKHPGLTRDLTTLVPPRVCSREVFKQARRCRNKYQVQQIEHGTPTAWLAHNGVILVSVELQHFGFTAAVAGTYFLNPSTEQELQYRAILDAFQATITALRPSASMAAPYLAAVKSLQAAGQVRSNQQFVGGLSGLQTGEIGQTPCSPA